MTSRTPRSFRRLCVAAVAVVAVAPLVPAAASADVATTAASATFRRTVERDGACRFGSADWDLKAQRRAGGRVYVEFEIDDTPRGQRWQLFVAADGRRIAAVTRTSVGLARGVQVSRLIRNRAGRERIRAAGVNPRSGNTCRGRLRF
jgi:hypothetical protein